MEIKVLIEKDIKQLKKGILKILVLYLLLHDKKYGYELLVEISQRSNGFFEIKEGTLYPILYKLEEDNLLTSEWQFPHDKMRAKKYYSITPKGKSTLKELITFWNSLTTNVQTFLEQEDI